MKYGKYIAPEGLTALVSADDSCILAGLAIRLANSQALSSSGVVLVQQRVPVVAVLATTITSLTAASSVWLIVVAAALGEQW